MWNGPTVRSGSQMAAWHLTSKNEHGSPRFKSKRRKRDRWPVRGAWRLLWFITVGIPVTPRGHIPPAIQGTRSSCLGAKHHRKAAKSGLAVLLQTHLWFQGAFELCAGKWVGKGASERGGGRKLLTKRQREAKRRMLGVAGRSWDADVGCGAGKSSCRHGQERVGL